MAQIIHPTVNKGKMLASCKHAESEYRNGNILIYPDPMALYRFDTYKNRPTLPKKITVNRIEFST